MNVEIGTEATQFPEKEYLMGFSLQCRQQAVSKWGRWEEDNRQAGRKWKVKVTRECG
jgi:hypothetical protein